MSRMKRLGILGVVGAAIITSLAVAADHYLGSPAPSSRSFDFHHPNIVFILTDDQRLDTLSFMPNVKELLAAHGVTFTNAFVTTSLCCPSRASILTGQYSRHTGVLSNVPPDGGAPSLRDASTVATWLHDGGYRTALVGKYLNAYNLLDGRIPPGWDYWAAIDNDAERSHYYDFTLNENGRLVHYGTGPADYTTTVLGKLAAAFVENARPPFFLYLATVAPHDPATIPPGAKLPPPRDRLASLVQ